MEREIKVKKIYGGLLPTNKSKMKFSFGATFGYPDPKTLPDEYDVGAPLEIKNQGNLFICVAEALTAVSEYQEGVKLEPAYTIKLISEIEGDTNWVYRGTSLHNGAKASLKGFLARQDSLYSVENNEVDTYALPSNWPATYDDLAAIHAKQAWFWIGVSGKLKMFDAIRCAMWQFKDEHRAVLTGIVWNDEWTDEVYIEKEGTPAGGHAICIKGWVGDWLKVQNSIGESVGEGGIQYLHKNIANKCLNFKAIVFKDLPENLTEEQIKEKSKYYRANIFKKLLLTIKKLWQ